MRSDAQIVTQTNELARIFYARHGNQVPEGYRFDQAIHPQERLMWIMACDAQLELTETDPNDALANEEQ
jgi:hypothetical protein